MRWIHLVFAAMFAVSALLQYNDPDPIAWMLMWGAAAVVAALNFRGKSDCRVLAALAVVCVAWMALLAPGMIDFVRLGDWRLLTATMQAGQPLIEQAREFLGLGLILVYALLSMAGRRFRALVAR